MKNRYFTIMVIPEQSSRVRKFVLPAWAVRGGMTGFFFALVFGLMMIANYWNVLGQVGENRQLRIENRRLKQQVQVFENKITTIESTMDRIKTFAARLRVITNIEDRSNLVSRLNEKLPDAATNVGSAPTELPEVIAAMQALTQSASADEDAPRRILDEDPEVTALRRDYEKLDIRFAKLNYDTLYTEQILQDQYELLADQKAFLAALPTRRPSIGYFTSGFGVRKSPFGGRDKMHEGLDIANQPGTHVFSTADGTVVFADSKAGYGQTVIIDHGYGLQTWYGHNRKLKVNRGQKVHRGQVIAELGSSGRSTGPHVHYEVRVNGTPVDPLSYILEN